MLLACDGERVLERRVELAARDVEAERRRQPGEWPVEHAGLLRTKRRPRGAKFGGERRAALKEHAEPCVGVALVERACAKQALELRHVAGERGEDARVGRVGVVRDE